MRRAIQKKAKFDIVELNTIKVSSIISFAKYMFIYIILIYVYVYICQSDYRKMVHGLYTIFVSHGLPVIMNFLSALIVIITNVCILF